MGETAATVVCPRCRAEVSSKSRYCSKCGQAVSDAAATLTIPGSLEARLKEELYFAPGASFGPRYRIIEEIGRGGMGRVYKAEDLELGTVVALKMIRPEYSSSRTMIAHFKKETLLARSVSHENVVRTHDLGEVGPVRYISMDYIKGGNLEDLIRTSGQLSPETTVRVIEQVCEALAAAHGKGIVHQDLKPQNILIDHSGKAYITDFGLARTLSGPGLETSGKIYGTPQYFAPEQARGEPADERSDIYSLGVILYEMLTGTLPFKASTIEGFIRKHTSEVPPVPSKVVRGVPSAWDAVVSKCLAKKREERYPTVAALQADLRVLSVASSKRRHVQSLALAAVVLAVFGGALWLFLRPKPAPVVAGDERISVAVLFSVNSSDDAGLADHRWMITELLIAGLSQSKYLRVLPLDYVLQILTNLGQIDAPRPLSGILDKIAASERIGYFVLPSFIRAGDKLRVTATIRKARSTETLGAPEAEGPVESLPATVQELSARTRAIFIAVPDDTAVEYNRALDKIATPSLEALASYIEGERLYALADYAGSIRALERAVAADPDFAMAYWRMAVSLTYLGNIGRAKSAIEKALSLSDRVSARDRYLIEGFAALSLEADPLKAIGSYKMLLTLYPNDETGISYLGSIYRNIEEWDAALAQFERLRTMDPGNISAYENLAFVYTAKGWYDRALELLRAAGKIFPGVRFFDYQSNLIHVVQGRYDEADTGVKSALARDPNDKDALEFKADIALLRGELDAARTGYEHLHAREETAGGTQGIIGSARLALLGGRYAESRTDLQRANDSARAANREFDEMEIIWDLGYLSLRQGRFLEAEAAADQILKIGRKIGQSFKHKLALLLKGMALAGAKKPRAAKDVLADLKQEIERSGYRSHMRYVHLLDGRIALAEGRPAAAVIALEQALTLLPFQRGRFDELAFFLDGLAEAYDFAGSSGKAAEAYRSILGLTTGRLRWGDIYALAHFRLGKLQLEKGASGEAAALMEEFLALWRNADPGRPEVYEAKKILSDLRSGARGRQRPS